MMGDAPEGRGGGEAESLKKAVYGDALQPAVREVGAVLARTVRAALAPLRGLLWGWEQIEEHFIPALIEKLARVPEERIITPNPSVAGPALEAMRFTGTEPSLREMFANLLPTAMDRETAANAHPAFVEIIKQLTSDEARIVNLLPPKKARPIISLYARLSEPAGARYEVISHFSLLGVEAGCVHPERTPQYLENLRRLGLVDLPHDVAYTVEGVYEPLERHPDIIRLKEQIQAKEKQTPQVYRGCLFVTNFGAQFLETCVVEHKAS